ncbi:sulfatase-like hydrolase/transferase [Porticoccus sp. GXU_MW_L64]
MNRAFIEKLLCGVAIAATSLFSALGTAAEKPNLIVILTDDQGYEDVGFNGSKDIKTPHIDRIANEGVRFTNGYVSYSVCGPSRAGLLTGRYQDRFGFSRNPVVDPSDRTAGLPLQEQMISEVLQPRGYISGIVGKWHMGTHKQFRPNQRGFDYFYGFLSGGHRYLPEEITIESIEDAVKQNHWDWYRTRLLENETRVDIDEYLTDELSHKALEFIEREKDKPFFLYLAYNAPHGPLQATEQYLQRNQHINNLKRRTYAGMITAVDDGVGRILDKLEQLGIDDNTLIFFLSDNGGPVKDGAASNAPLKGGKGSYFEGGIRVPFAARWPGKIPAGVDYHHPVISLDILGTMAALTGAKTSPERPLDGVNLMPYLNGDKKGKPHHRLFWRKYDGQSVFMREGHYKSILDSRNQYHILYNLEKDIGENNNLRKKKNSKYRKMVKEMEAWHSEMVDPPFRPLQGFDNPRQQREQ